MAVSQAPSHTFLPTFIPSYRHHLAFHDKPFIIHSRGFKNPKPNFTVILLPGRNDSSFSFVPLMEQLQNLSAG